MDVSASTNSGSAFTYSLVFNDADADLSIVSSDNVVFKVYRKYLEANTSAFPPSDHIAADQEPVRLEETSEVLETLFKFIHPPTEAMQYRQPSVMEMETISFFSLAEAAEKYVVFGAVNLCWSRMCYTGLVESHPFEILNYAHKHGYPELEEKAAFVSVSRRVDLEEIHNVISGIRLQMKWLRYQHQWAKIGEFVREQAYGYVSRGYKCLRMTVLYLQYANNMSQDIRKATKLPDLDMSVQCPWGGGAICGCSQRNNWQASLDIMGGKVRKFSEITL